MNMNAGSGCRQGSLERVIARLRQQKYLAEVEHLSREQTGTETRDIGPLEEVNEIGRWQIMIMMSPLVVPAESTVKLR